jgi:hypothetical protein
MELVSGEGEELAPGGYRGARAREARGERDGADDERGAERHESAREGHDVGRRGVEAVEEREALGGGSAEADLGAEPGGGVVDRAVAPALEVTESVVGEGEPPGRRPSRELDLSPEVCRAGKFATVARTAYPPA